MLTCQHFNTIFNNQLLEIYYCSLGYEPLDHLNKNKLISLCFDFNLNVILFANYF